jgi:hypothetical protein
VAVQLTETKREPNPRTKSTSQINNTRHEPAQRKEHSHEFTAPKSKLIVVVSDGGKSGNRKSRLW